MNLLITLFVSSLSWVSTNAQEIEMPPGAVVRVIDCTITSDRFTFDELVARARQLDFDENAPNAIGASQCDWAMQLCEFEKRILMIGKLSADLIQNETNHPREQLVRGLQISRVGSEFAGDAIDFSQLDFAKF